MTSNSYKGWLLAVAILATPGDATAQTFGYFGAKGRRTGLN
jgi:hypothetical protein